MPPTYVMVGAKPSKYHKPQRLLWYVLKIYDKLPPLKAALELEIQRHISRGYVTVRIYKLTDYELNYQLTSNGEH